MKKLKQNLKSCLKKENFLVDIFLIGSALKSKTEPGDIDIISLFRDKDYEKIENINYKIKEIGDKLNLKLHIEPIIIDDLFNQKIYISILHEGFSIKNMKLISEILKFEPDLLITYSLKDKKASDKVRFSYALYGRKKGEGFLKDIKGKEVSKGSILVPIDKQELVREFFRQWNISFNEQRISIFKS